MNPNTVNLYDATEDDSLVGNFEVEEETGTRASSTESASIPELLTSALCLSYASSYVINPGGYPGADPGDNTGGGNGYQEQVVSSWHEILKINPILEDYVAWGQDEPFNDLYPERNYFLSLNYAGLKFNNRDMQNGSLRLWF